MHGGALRKVNGYIRRKMMVNRQSVEPNIADLANGWLKSYGLDYKLEQESYFNWSELMKYTDFVLLDIK